jgi:hypothetical protein
MKMSIRERIYKRRMVSAVPWAILYYVNPEGGECCGGGIKYRKVTIA